MFSKNLISKISHHNRRTFSFLKNESQYNQITSSTSVYKNKTVALRFRPNWCSKCTNVRTHIDSKKNNFFYFNVSPDQEFSREIYDELEIPYESKKILVFEDGELVKTIDGEPHATMLSLDTKLSEYLSSV